MKKKFANVLVAGAIAASVMMSGGAFAETTDASQEAADSMTAMDTNYSDGVLNPSNGAVIKKIVNVADGIDFTNFDSYTFTFTQFDGNATEANAQNADGVTQPMTVETFTKTMTKVVTKTTNYLTDGVTEYTGYMVCDLSDKLTTAGEYTFNIVETSPKAAEGATEGWTQTSDKTYRLKVYVKNDGKGGFTYEYGMFDEADLTNTAEDKANKKENAEFENTYEKNTAELTISKAVVGSSADLTKQFEYEIVFTYPTVDGGLDDAHTLTKGTNVVFTRTSTTADDAKQVVADNKFTFTLADKDSVKFTGLPVGTTYTLNEAGEQNYVAKVAVTENGATAVNTENSETNTKLDAQGKARDEKGTTTILVGENTNKADFTNTMKEVTITGVVTNIAPFVAMMVAAIAAIALYLVGKRKLRAI